MAKINDIRVLVIKDGDSFAAQCLEYDLCTQGGSPEEALARMDCLLEIEASERLREFGVEFGGLDSAPAGFHKMWAKAERPSSTHSSYEVAFSA